MTFVLRPTILFLFMILSGLMARAQDPETLVRQWLLAHGPEWGLTVEDARNVEVTDSPTDKNGTTYIYIRQTAHGVPVDGAVANFVVKDGQVRGAGNRMQGQLATRLAAADPGITPEEALLAAARYLGLQVGEVDTEETISATEAVLGPCGISRDAIPARLAYRVVAGKSAIPLAWHLVIRTLDGQHWWHVAVDAHNGTVVWKNDWMSHCTIPPGSFSRGYNAMDELGLGGAAALGGASAGYRVFPLPTESPLHGPHTWVEDPADPLASPHGWHDTNGMPGAEYTITRGNNVYAGEDWDDDDEIGYSPDGGPSLVFDYPYDLGLGPQGYIDAAVTNLFYTCNVLHDVLYHYGFDEAGGNFQRLNYTGAGEDGDEVIAQAQDGGGTNNANFGTPPDGWSGYMQMYLWRTTEGDTLTVHGPASVAGDYAAVLASFGPMLSSPGITAELVLVEDAVAPASDGCETILNGAELQGKIAVVDRGLCTFVSKVEALEAAGAAGVVVINNTAGAPITMGGDAGQITIPSVMISMSNGQLLKNAMGSGPVNATLHGPGLESLRDGDFDNSIIAHEYGHGVSNRLTGGPSNTDCLWNDEQMGEGWSDWLAMVLSMRAGDQAETARGMSNYVLNEGLDGVGLRTAPYTTNMAVNPYTYGSSNNFGFQESHALGFLWATMLWDLTWALVEEEGFDPDLYHGTGGNNTAIRLVMEGMRLQPCEPGFVDGRDAILLADEMLYDGGHECIIWNAFARRGLGLGASQGSSNSVNDQVEAFNVPIACATVGIGEEPFADGLFSLVPNPATASVTIRLRAAAQAPATVRLISVDGRLVKELTLRGGIELPVDLQGVVAGLYVVQVEMDGKRMQQRLVAE